MPTPKETPDWIRTLFPCLIDDEIDDPETLSYWRRAYEFYGEQLAREILKRNPQHRCPASISR